MVSRQELQLCMLSANRFIIWDGSRDKRNLLFLGSGDRHFKTISLKSENESRPFHSCSKEAFLSNCLLFRSEPLSRFYLQHWPDYLELVAWHILLNQVTMQNIKIDSVKLLENRDNILLEVVNNQIFVRQIKKLLVLFGHGRNMWAKTQFVVQNWHPNVRNSPPAQHQHRWQWLG